MHCEYYIHKMETLPRLNLVLDGDSKMTLTEFEGDVQSTVPVTQSPPPQQTQPPTVEQSLVYSNEPLSGDVLNKYAQLQAIAVSLAKDGYIVGTTTNGGSDMHVTIRKLKIYSVPVKIGKTAQGKGAFVYPSDPSINPVIRELGGAWNDVKRGFVVSLPVLALIRLVFPVSEEFNEPVAASSAAIHFETKMDRVYLCGNTYPYHKVLGHGGLGLKYEKPDGWAVPMGKQLEVIQVLAKAGANVEHLRV